MLWGSSPHPPTMETREVLDAIAGDPELLAAHDAVPEFRNLMTHVTQASSGEEAIRVLCRGFMLPAAWPQLREPAELAPSTDPMHP